MKYKFITTVLCLAVLSFTACGNNAETVSQNDAVMETEKMSETVETMQTEEVSDTTENMEETEIESEIVETQINTETTEVVEETVTEETPNPQTIVVKELNQTMYAKQSVNVRKGDSTDYEKIGALSFNQQVQVTGQSEATGWYRIEFNGEVGFVSKNYLSTEKTVVTQSQNQNNNNGGNNNNNNNGNTGGGTSSNEGQGDEPADWEAPEDYNPGPAEGETTIDLDANDEKAGDGGELITDIELNEP